MTTSVDTSHMFLNLLPVEIDGVRRAAKTEVCADLFKVKQKNTTWYATLHKNLGVFCDGDTEVRADVIDDLVRRFALIPDSVRLWVFDRAADVAVAGDFRKSLHHRKKSALTYTVIEDDVSIFDRVSQIGAYRKEVSELAAANGMVEPSNKRMDVIVLHFSDADVRKIASTPKLTAALKSLLQSSRKQRIALFLLLDSTDGFPVELIRSLDWAAFVGSDAAFSRREVYADLDDALYDVDQQVVGNLYRSNVPDELSVIHPRRFTKSKWRVEEDARIADEVATYDEYLSTLDDGSV